MNQNIFRTYFISEVILYILYMNVLIFTGWDLLRWGGMGLRLGWVVVDMRKWEEREMASQAPEQSKMVLWYLGYSSSYMRMTATLRNQQESVFVPHSLFPSCLLFLCLLLLSLSLPQGCCLLMTLWVSAFAHIACVWSDQLNQIFPRLSQV